jgi:hypothetical protein
LAQPPSKSAIRNKLLAALPSDALARLLPKLHAVTLPLRKTLCIPQERIEAVYFIESGWVSMVAHLDEGTGCGRSHLSLQSAGQLSRARVALPNGQKCPLGRGHRRKASRPVSADAPRRALVGQFRLGLRVAGSEQYELRPLTGKGLTVVQTSSGGSARSHG